MLNIISHLGNANQNHNEIYTTSHPPGWLKLKRQKVISIRKDVEKLEPSYIIDRIIKWCSSFGKQFGRSSKC